uniref:Putative secreted protein salivary gland overexpressed n=1 Tax=Rhipicephalus microplus TaxID=6941 RepID=A0A6M2DA58_RHIMP
MYYGVCLVLAVVWRSLLLRVITRRLIKRTIKHLFSFQKKKKKNRSVRLNMPESIHNNESHTLQQRLHSRMSTAKRNVKKRKVRPNVTWQAI